MYAFGGVFDGVVEDVDDGGAEVFGDAEGVEADSAGDGFEDDAARRKWWRWRVMAMQSATRDSRLMMVRFC